MLDTDIEAGPNLVTLPDKLRSQICPRERQKYWHPALENTSPKINSPRNEQFCWIMCTYKPDLIGKITSIVAKK